ADPFRVHLQPDPVAPERSVPGPTGHRVLAVPRHAAFRPGGGRGGSEEPAHGAAQGPAATPLRAGAAAGGVGRRVRVPLQLPARAVWPAPGLPVPGAWAGEPGPPEPAHRQGRCTGAAFRALPAGLARATHARPVVLRAAAAGRRGDPPTL